MFTKTQYYLVEVVIQFTIKSTALSPPPPCTSKSDEPLKINSTTERKLRTKFQNFMLLSWMWGLWRHICGWLVIKEHRNSSSWKHKEKCLIFKNEPEITCLEYPVYQCLFLLFCINYFMSDTHNHRQHVLFLNHILNLKVHSLTLSLTLCLPKNLSI